MKRILIGAVSWIGDTIMCLPAVEGLREAFPGAHMAVLAKPAVRGLWTMHGVVDEVCVLDTRWKALPGLIAQLRRGRYDVCYVLPHSFRSAFLPFAAGIPCRIGMPGHARDWMLTKRVPVEHLAARHQAYEYFHLFGLDAPGSLAAPRLEPPATGRAWAGEQVRAWPLPWYGILPGAARGESKCWPEDRYALLARRVLARNGGTALVMGAASEGELCARVARGIGEHAVNCAGKTSLAQWAALLERCSLVAANDSGGMHLAASLGVPVMAFYGITDPQKTGPLGIQARVFQKSPVRDRRVPRESDVARERLAAITVEDVLPSALDMCAGSHVLASAGGSPRAEAPGAGSEKRDDDC